MDIMDRLEMALVEMGTPKHKVKGNLASVCDITPQAVHAWFKTGKKRPSADHLDRIASFYNINLHWLITGKGGMNSSIPESEKEVMVVDLMRQLPPHLQALALRQLQLLLDTDQE